MSSLSCLQFGRAYCTLWALVVLAELTSLPVSHGGPILVGVGTVSNVQHVDVLPDPEQMNPRFMLVGGRMAGASGNTKESTAEKRSSIISSGKVDKMLPRCRRTREVKDINVPGCAPISVNVGGCHGACKTKVVLSNLENKLKLIDGAYRFPVAREGKCCQPKATELRDKTLSCDNGLSRTIQVEVITNCHCKVTPASGGL